MADYDHEAEVTRFFAQRQKDSPDWYQEVCARYPVLSKRQMRRRVETEIPISQFPDDMRRWLEDLFYSSAEDVDDRVEAL